jgi:lipoprotein-anchoring transpeptidase ErfK/SrfK
MQKRYKSLIGWIILLCFLLSTVSALALRHFTMTHAGSVHAIHSSAARNESNSSDTSSNWEHQTNIGLGKAAITQIGLHPASTIHTSRHPASSLGKDLKYTTTGSLVRAMNTHPAPNSVVTPLAPSDQGKIILISLSNQHMYMYQDGKEVADTLITTGRPGLDTPAGTFHVFNKESPTTFYSIWPPGSPNYFAPTHINFALEFLSPGYFIHDSLWRHVYGPGSNDPHIVGGYGVETGSHGCVNVPYAIMPWIYNWTDINTTVQVS